MMSIVNADKVTLAITGMTCGSCRNHVREALLRVSGVRHAVVDDALGMAEVVFAPAETDSWQLVRAVEAAGYVAREVAEPATQPVLAGGESCCSSR